MRLSIDNDEELPVLELEVLSEGQLQTSAISQTESADTEIEELPTVRLILPQSNGTEKSTHHDTASTASADQKSTESKDQSHEQSTVSTAPSRSVASILLHYSGQSKGQASKEEKGKTLSASIVHPQERRSNPLSYVAALRQRQEKPRLVNKDLFDGAAA